MSDASEGLANLPIHMVEILGRVLPYILGEEGDVWGWYPNADRLDKDDKPKYNGFVFYERKEGGDSARYLVFHEESDIEARLEILEAKASALTLQVKSSICVRNLKASPPIYGGAGACQADQNGDVWIYVGSGAPELVDHLLISALQWFAGKITIADHTERTDLDYPGIWDAMAKAGMHAGTYMAMRASIEARFRAATGKKM